jgi:hypothetical protein
MDCGLLIAAGGGGDAIAAAILHQALNPSGQRPQIVTYSWDRLLIDPLPGPRHPSSFTRLQPVGDHNYRVTSDTTVRPPAGSTLPQLAAELRAELFLLDPSGGAQGLARQLSELARLLDRQTVTIVDVGGDILAHGDEPTLQSPLADSLVLAATATLDNVQVLVTGAGIDGELPEGLVLERYEQLGAQTIHTLSTADVNGFRPLFEWHPSEATGLLCAAAAGVRGIAEIRARLHVELTDHTPEIARLDYTPVMRANQLAQQLVDTGSLAEADEALRSAGRDSEIDYERRKARQLDRTRQAKQQAHEASDRPSLHNQLLQIQAQATRQSLDFITFRSLAERLDLPGSRLAELQDQLRAQRPGEYDPPLWTIHPVTPKAVPLARDTRDTGR